VAEKHERAAGGDESRAGLRGPMNRRTALTALGVAGVGLATAAAVKAATGSHAGAGPRRPATAAPASGGTALACVLTPEETAGPYYLDYGLVRRDITDGYPGVPLTLSVTVVDAATCAPVTGAALDVWHCNALGEYSGYTSMGIGGAGGGTGSRATPRPPATPAPGGGHVSRTDHLTFLRGVQFTDHRGVGEFQTLYPGWYKGRAVHIHVKVRIGGQLTRRATYAGGHVAHTGQLYFPEQSTEEVARLDPYRINHVTRVRNQNDAYFTAGDDSGLLTLRPLGEDSTLAHGLLAAIVVGVDPLAIPAPVAT
jgi:protocatechuate 3,4-dioxygenase beta subunit